VRIGFVLLFGWLGALTAWAAPDSVKLTFPAQAEYLVWVQSESETFLTDRATNIQGTSGEVKVVAAGDKPSVYVLDGTSNLLAIKGLSEVKDGAWSLKKDDFSRIARLDLTAETTKGKVASGLFRVRVGDQTRTALLTPEDKGRITIWNLPPGPVEVVFETKAGEKTLATPAQRVQLNREAGRVGVLVTADDAAPVVEQEKDPATGREPGAGALPGSLPTEPAAPRASGGVSPLVSLLTGLIGLAAVGGVIFWLLKYKGDQVQGFLKQAGLAQAAPTADDGDPTPPVAIPQRQGPGEKIVLDPVATPMANPMTASVAPVAAPSSPRLVLSTGSQFPLTPGTFELGREVAGPLAMPQESSVSRRHAQFEWDGAHLTVTDLGSTNGTYVRGTKITGPTPILPGDTVQCGAIVLRFEG